MKAPIVAAVGLGLAIASAVAVGQDAPKGAAPAAPQLKDLKSQASYSLGLLVARDLKAKGADAGEIDPDLFAQGFKDAMTGGKALLADEQIRQVLQSFNQQIMAKRMEAAKGAGEKNKKEGEEFLAANKTKAGVVTLPSGLQYKVLKEGTGKTPKATDTISAHYRGTTLDGNEFDSSYKRGQPASFPVNRVIKGWTEALQLMKVGSKWQLFIPPSLAYGETPPSGSAIGPNSVLLFDVELLGVE
jgi:FKBP-type peptidyl-prolyl cis-trans isomerase FklB